MLQWWLNFRWASEMHGDALAKIDAGIVLFAATLVALALVG